MSKPSGAAVAAKAIAAVSEGHTYAEMDCQAYVEYCVNGCGGHMAYAGSNDMYRNASAYQFNGTQGVRLKMIWCGSDIVQQHSMNFEKIIDQIHEIDYSAINSIQEAFRITLDRGVLIDKTINSRPVFEIVTMDNVYSQ